MTFPAWEVDGRMVAGFPLPDYDRNHTQPPELAVLAARRPARGDVVVFQSTDFAQHRLLEMYRRIDAMVGEAREVMRAEGAVAVVSDHGFGPHPRTFVRTDRLLVDAASCPRAARPGAEST